MTIGEQGAYLRLLMMAWTDPDCSLPKDSNELKELALWMPETHGSFERVRACFLPHPEKKKTRLYNPRLYEEWVKVEDLKARRKEAAQVRWHKPSNGPATPKIPPTKPTDRTTQGFQPISDDVRTVTDKWFPPG